MSNSEFGYLSKKILEAEIHDSPYPHLEIENFLSPEHFQKVVQDNQIHFEECSDTKDLLKKLKQKNYEVITFPGCNTDINMYLNSLETGEWKHGTRGNPIESYGVTLRLMKYNSDFLSRLIKYMNGEEFESSMKKKFGIEEKTEIISAVQKNLTRYEISPHPDVSKKCMTYLLNINKDEAKGYDIHTHMLKFKKEYDYIYETWEMGDLEREWVPWDWCETVKKHTKNNSIIMFTPSHRTLHAVKMDYPHTKFQRTQIYGNLMYPGRNVKKYRKNKYHDLKVK